MEQRYANILFDDAFKVVVCAPGNERLLIKLIETLIPEKSIMHLELQDKENHGLSLSDKIATFDLLCTSDDGEQFIVEMQHSPQRHYADRMLCYATYPIRNQLADKLVQREERIKRGESVDKMDYGLLPVYVVSIVNFCISHESDDALEDKLISRYSIRCNGNGELMTNALHFVFLEIGRLKAKKGETHKCRTLLEKLAYSLKYMHEMDERPRTFKEEVLKLLFDASEFANMDTWQQFEYENIMRTELDIIAEKAYARETGLAEGREEGRAEGRAEGREEGRAEGREEGLAEGRVEGRAESQVEIARRLLAMGLGVEQVAQGTGLAVEEVEKLQGQASI